MRIAVTGSSGKLGSVTVERLRGDGHEVIGLDRAGAAGPGFTQVDLSDYGQTLDALLGVTARHTGVDALVHLAAIPVNGLVPDITTFQNNLAVTGNVLFAALRADIHRVVAASSITAMGFPFEVPPPRLPVDEEYTAAYNSYGLAKVMEEAMFGQLVGWDPQLSITALRFTNVVCADEYSTFARATDPEYRRDLIGTYIDARDGAQAVALALAAGEPGFETYAVAAPDSGSAIPSRELANLWFPGVPVDPTLGDSDALISTRKAQEKLGFAAEHRWRDEFRY